MQYTGPKTEPRQQPGLAKIEIPPAVISAIDAQEKLKKAVELSPLAHRWESEPIGTAHRLLTLEGEDYFIIVAPAKEHERFSGNWVATLFPVKPTQKVRDRSWPRFYFCQYRARAEVEQWMITNGQITAAETKNTQQ